VAPDSGAWGVALKKGPCGFFYTARMDFINDTFYNVASQKSLRTALGAACSVIPFPNRNPSPASRTGNVHAHQVYGR